ncbi:MAG: hypothetical protein OSB33_03200 [Candidatus Poseidoniales archaeon]|nr:hypothetical protein [Candidatus Poseidoniales archaeon]
MMRTPHVTVSTRVMPHEIGQKCVDAVRKIFPNFLVTDIPTEDSFPVEREMVEFVCDGVSPDLFVELLGNQRILDTALDAMSLNLRADATNFLISRQAALSGKVAFVLETERTVGGVVEVALECDDLADWIQEVTWHPGRREVPRSVGDELSMRSDGSLTEWFDSKGRATFQTDD